MSEDSTAVNGRGGNNGAGGQPPPGSGAMSRVGIAIISAYMFLVSLLIIWALVSLWPPLRPAGNTNAPNTNSAGGNANSGGANTNSAQGGSTTTRTNTSQGSTSPGPTPNANGNANTGTTQGNNNIGNTATAPASPTATATPPPSNGNQNANAAAAAGASPSPSPSPAESGEAGFRIKGGRCVDEEGNPKDGMAPIKVFRWRGCVYDEDRLFMLVLLAGALGALIHGIRSFAWYVGNRQAVWSWASYYLALPFFGAGLALIFYLVIRGGFFSANADVSDTSPFAFAALAALIGMFSEEAVQKLKGIAETILAPAEKGKDHIDAPKINKITPNSGSVKGGNTVVISGENFSTDAKVTFGGREAVVKTAATNSLTVVVPQQVDGKPGKVDVVVTNKDNQKDIEKEGYEYKAEPSGQAPPQPPGQQALSVTSITPNDGPTAGGTKVEIKGTGFKVGAKVSFGNVPSKEVSFIDASTLRTETPQHATATLNVDVINPDNQTATLNNGFTYKD